MSSCRSRLYPRDWHTVSYTKDMVTYLNLRIKPSETASFVKESKGAKPPAVEGHNATSSPLTVTSWETAASVIPTSNVVADPTSSSPRIQWVSSQRLVELTLTRQGGNHPNGHRRYQCRSAWCADGSASDLLGLTSCLRVKAESVLT